MTLTQINNRFSIFMLLFALSFSSYADLSLVSQNLRRLFDDRQDGKEEKVLSSQQYQQRLQNLVDKIASDFEFPDVLALQEVENLRILQQLSQMLQQRHRLMYQAILIEGNDPSGIDVGLLVKQEWRVAKKQALFSDRVYLDQGDRLFARPPLLVELCQNECVQLINLHLRSMRGLNSHKRGERVARKRQLQAETLARWINEQQQRQPGISLILTGDLNALQPSDRHVDTVGTLIGLPDNKRPRWKSPDLIQQDLVDISRQVPLKQRYSYLYKGNKQQLDYILVSQNLKPRLRSIRFGPLDSVFSDHAAIMAIFAVD